MDVVEPGLGLTAHRPALVGLTAAFVVSRLAMWAAGMGFTAVGLHPRTVLQAQWQLLAPTLLRHQLATSLWHLASQPPLYNLAVAGLLRLPVGAQVPVAALAMAGLGLVMVLCTYGTLVDLGVRRGVAVAAGLLLVASPDVAVYERWLFYAEPTASLLAVAMFCGVRFLRTERLAWGSAFFSAGGAVVLLNSSYQWVWWVAAAAPIATALRHRWRTVVSAAVLPALVVGTWYVKDAVLFGTATTSSWLGMNLARATVAAQPPGVISSLVRRRVLSPLAEMPPFEPVAAYVPRFVAKPPHTGVAALDRRIGAAGSSNFDNLAYVAVSEAYLSQDLRFVRADPGRYLAVVGRAMAVWSVPGDDYPFVAGVRAPIAGYAHLWDVVVGWQAHPDLQAGLTAVRTHRGPSAAQVSWSAILLTVLAIAGAPIVVWGWWRRDAVRAAGLAFVWCTVVYAFALTSLVELGENNRFRMELGPLPLVAAVVVGSVVVRGSGRCLRRVRAARGG